VAEALSWISLHLICHFHGYVVDFSQPQQLVQALVKLLLTFSQVLSPNIFSSEMANHRVNCCELDVFFWTNLKQKFS
jgi:hypothetical protein